MGFRFRKRISILPGLALNLSKTGVSASIGRRGATLNIGARGTKETIGLRGSGLSYSQQQTWPHKGVAVRHESGGDILRLVILLIAFAVIWYFTRQ